ncbi:hypothetical protein CPIN18021_0272 [Campylobacter pinnipediorum subsp. caledonicus]|uniref:Uncharacterized protein n=1 Tax=Campylobacter pinnipediorum subsp. caledonicus TaxID=1874362 RepID=A0A1S6U612_9BACT|nr:hypothetical protein [Campylobacter pinnipediorum]AQW87119.1 hypothetical protein CPIN18021_0272 [Campylobacter pinnipediorum subsp. caledonicus]
MIEIKFISLQKIKYGKYKARLFNEKKNLVLEINKEFRLNELGIVGQEIIKAEKKIKEEEEPRLL